MKFLFSLFAIVIITQSCNSKKEVVSNSEESKEIIASKPSRKQSNSKSDIVKDNYNRLIITYKTTTRGSFKYIQVSKSAVVISEDRSLKNKDTYPCKTKDWEVLSNMILKVNDTEFQKLKAPTDKRLYDGAAHASLSIIKGDLELMTPSFDHGSPPKEVEALVNKVLSIKENVIKQ